MNINIHEFKKQFDKEYTFLYEHCDRVAGYEEAVEAFDEFQSEYGDFVWEFCQYRGDYITSDREMAAFMFALESFEIDEVDEDEIADMVKSIADMYGL